MTVVAGQNCIIKHILNTQNDEVLQQVEKILNSTEIVAYDSEGNPLTAEQYRNEINTAMISKEVVSHNEVFKKIRNAYGLE